MSKSKKSIHANNWLHDSRNRPIGFRDADCFYKNGIFTLYGGRK